jgi:hypothetical protein
MTSSLLAELIRKSKGNGVPNPGATMINGGWRTYPLYYSCPNMTNINGSLIDDKYIVFPCYKIVVYKRPNYNGESFAHDNALGGKPICSQNHDSFVNESASYKLFYKNVIVDDSLIYQ